MPLQTGTFVISLDFELHWGRFHKVPLEKKAKHYKATRKLIPEILKLFAENKIECTWAVVGLLFNESIESIKNNIPKATPKYVNRILSAYNYVQNNDLLDKEKYFLARDLIKEIYNTKGQEIASHTYSHYFVQELGQNMEQFESDLDMSKQMATSMGIELHSLVLPKNQYNPSYDTVCKARNIKVLRVVPNTWVFKGKNRNSFLKKALRIIDCYVPIFNTSINLTKFITANQSPIHLPTCRFFRPISGVKFLDKLRLNRIKAEMTRAAKDGMYYHLWWHPHNFGKNPDQAMVELKEIVNHFNWLNQTYKMKSLTMNNTLREFTI